MDRLDTRVYIYILFSLKKIDLDCVVDRIVHMYLTYAFVVSIPLVLISVPLFTLVMVALICASITRMRRKREEEEYAAVLQLATRRKLSLRSYHTKTPPKYHSD